MKSRYRTSNINKKIATRTILRLHGILMRKVNKEKKRHSDESYYE